MLPPYLQPRGTLAPQVPSILSVLRGGAASPMGALGYPTPPAGGAAPGIMDQLGSKMMGKLGDAGADGLLGLLKNGGLKSLLGGGGALEGGAGYAGLLGGSAATGASLGGMSLADMLGSGMIAM